MGNLLTKPGVQYTIIAPGGQKILDALKIVCSKKDFNLTVTSACDGIHSGPADPHHSGNAYDVRSKDVEDKQGVLLAVMSELGAPTPSSGGYVTEKFFGWLEQADTDNEHFHFQLRHGQTYP